MSTGAVFPRSGDTTRSQLLSTFLNLEERGNTKTTQNIHHRSGGLPEEASSRREAQHAADVHSRAQRREDHDAGQGRSGVPRLSATQPRPPK